MNEFKELPLSYKIVFLLSFVLSLGIGVLMLDALAKGLLWILVLIR